MWVQRDYTTIYNLWFSSSKIVYNIPIEFNVLIELFRIFKIPLNKIHKAKQIYM
jgi:hypothetical protein